MFLMTESDITEQSNAECDNQGFSPAFGFNTVETRKYSGTSLNASDSAYDSMVCSPFSPVGLLKRHKTLSTTSHEPNTCHTDQGSPFLESEENDEVFQMSLEQISGQRICQKSEISTSNKFILNTTFRPIYAEKDLNREPSTDALIDSNLMSYRSISTQTRFTISSSATYRPNSAPLQEGIEEELEEIDNDRIVTTTNRIHRHSTCNCFRSPMPDLIQPTFRSSSQLLGSRLSLIADQIDDTFHAQTSNAHILRRNRRFSTSSITELSPGGSIFDLIVSIYNSFDNTLPNRQRQHSHTTGSR